MPITRQQFELGIDSEIEAQMRRLESFLTEHPEEAYSLEELWQQEFGAEPFPPASRGPSAPLDVQRFEFALEKLVDLRAADVRWLGDVTYYMVGRVPLTLSLGSSST